MSVAATHLIGCGMNSMVLWVLAENSDARRFYEALGGHIAGEQQVTIGRASLSEVAYGWYDLGRLTANSGTPSPPG